jgi:hypothetical protein
LGALEGVNVAPVCLAFPRGVVPGAVAGWAAGMLEAGVHVRAVSDSLGHSSAQVTLDTYGFTADKVARAAADGLAAMFEITAQDAPGDNPPGSSSRSGR